MDAPPQPDASHYQQAPTVRDRLERHLGVIYPELDPTPIIAALLEAMRLDEDVLGPVPSANHWSPADQWAICYGDTIVNDETTSAGEPVEPPLATLATFLKARFSDALSGVHVLPFFPYTSDHGFAVSDYLTVDPALGTWQHIEALAAQGTVMGDLVVNHCSSSHTWFQQFQNGEEPGRDYFVTAAPDADLGAVVRPRTSPLLRPTETPDGTRHVWCTFGHDQVDLNFANPAVLIEFAKILRKHLDHGVLVFRLDAVAFVWKELGTDCINRRETHEIVRLIRTLTECAEPASMIVTETNIPNRENLSYFGNNNEAHLVYNFSLPPLLLHTLLSGDCAHLRRWLMSMPPAQVGTTYFNFLASHDGIGLRPAEGLLSDAEITAMITRCEQAGGQVSYRAVADGRKPYEMNVALYDMLEVTHAGDDSRYQIDRFVCAHTIMMALEGIPAYYLNSLLATRNDQMRFAKTGKNRSLNRKQWALSEINDKLDDPDSDNAMIYQALIARMKIRAKQAAFHPNATQFTLHLGNKLFGFWRQSQDRRQSIFAINNVSSERVPLPLSDINLVVTDQWHDLLSDNAYPQLTETLILEPYQTIWLSNTAPSQTE